MAGCMGKMMMTNALQGMVIDSYKSKPAGMVKGFLKELGNYSAEELNQLADDITKDPERMARLPHLMEANNALIVYPDGHRGFVRDLTAVDEDVTFPYGDIKCPVLICHGDKDKDIPLELAQKAHAAIEGSILHIVPNGCHILPMNNDYPAMWKAQVDFAKQHLG